MIKIPLTLFIYVLTVSSLLAKEYEVNFSSIGYENEKKFILDKGKDLFEPIIKLDGFYDISFDKLDINNDKIEDLFVFIQSSPHCGNGISGCPTEVYLGDKGGNWDYLFGFRSLGKVIVNYSQDKNYQDIKVLGGTRHFKKNFMWSWVNKEYVRSVVDSGAKDE